jgi:hypothetical protein
MVGGGPLAVENNKSPLLLELNTSSLHEDDGENYINEIMVWTL